MQTFEISNKTYKTGQLKSRVANRVLFLLAKNVSSSLREILSNVLTMDFSDPGDKKKMAADISDSIKNSGTLITKLVSDIINSDPDDVFDIFEILASTTFSENGEQVDLSELSLKEVYTLCFRLMSIHLIPFSMPSLKIAEAGNLKASGEQN